MARKKMKGRSCYYHLCSRVAGRKDDFIFGDIEKEKGMKIVLDLSKLFFIEPISMCWMGNHWHIVVFAPEVPPSIEDAAAKYNAYYSKKNIQIDPKNNREKCEKIAEQLCDISFFMRQIHQKFTYYINRLHNRRGTLWAERFKSTILDGKESLWNCVKYVELNPVRAEMVSNPEDYRFSTWGYYCGTGRHFFKDNFERHMRLSMGEFAKKWTNDEVNAEFRGELARTIAYESSENLDPLKEKEKAKRKDSMPIRFLRRTRHWSDGAIIGSKSFVRDVAVQFVEKEKAKNKKLSKGVIQNSTPLYCFKYLRTDL